MERVIILLAGTYNYKMVIIQADVACDLKNTETNELASGADATMQKCTLVCAQASEVHKLLQFKFKQSIMMSKQPRDTRRNAGNSRHLDMKEKQAHDKRISNNRT